MSVQQCQLNTDTVPGKTTTILGNFVAHIKSVIVYLELRCFEHSTHNRTSPIIHSPFLVQAVYDLGS